MKICVCRYSFTKAFCIAFVMTFFSIFDVPVFWPILLCYWIVLFVLTMRRQIAHMIKYKYIPLSLGKQVTYQILLIHYASRLPFFGHLMSWHLLGFHILHCLAARALFTSSFFWGNKYNVSTLVLPFLYDQRNCYWSIKMFCRSMVAKKLLQVAVSRTTIDSWLIIYSN